MLKDELIKIAILMLTIEEFRTVVGRTCKTDKQKREAWKLYNSKTGYICKKEEHERINNFRY